MQKPTKPVAETEEAKAILGQYRQSIDRLDAILIYTLAERFKYTEQIGKLKAEYGLAPLDPEREKKHLEKIEKLAHDAGLDPHIGQEILKKIMAEVVKRHEEIASLSS